MDANFAMAMTAALGFVAYVWTVVQITLKRIEMRRQDRADAMIERIRAY